MKQLEKEKKASSIQENRIKQLQGLLQSQNKRHEEAIRNNEGRVIDLAKQLNNEKVKKGELQK